MAFSPFVNKLGDMDGSKSQIGKNGLDRLDDAGVSTLRVNKNARGPSRQKWHTEELFKSDLQRVQVFMAVRDDDVHSSVSRTQAFL